MTEKARCANCRHGEHEGDKCYWESPGGDLVGQYCTCEEYRPCRHPPEKRGPNNHGGNPTCGQCSEHFKSEEDYRAQQQPKEKKRMANKADVIAMLEKVGDDEPVFLLRAQDKIAPEIVREWAYRALSEDAPVEKVRGARTIADSMEDWQITHRRKVPD